MDSFMEALLCSEKSNEIPDAHDWFADFLGEWDFDYYDGYDGDYIRHLKGEWIFRRVLNGVGIQDLFISPPRETMKDNLHLEAGYGTSVRVYNTHNRCYDMFYVCA